MHQRPSTLKNILEEERGLLRFGRALRALGRSKRSTLNDLLDLLNSARTVAQMIQILGMIADQSELLVDRDKFIRVPDEDDLSMVLDQLQQYGVLTSAMVLIALSFVRYPRVTKPEDPLEAVENLLGAEKI